MRVELTDDGQFAQVDLLARLSALAVPLVTTMGLAFALALNASALLSGKKIGPMTVLRALWEPM